MNTNDSMNISLEFRSDTSIKLERWQRYPLLSPEIRIFFTCMMILALVVGCLTNSVVLVLFTKYRSLQTTSNIFLINLTIADLLMSTFCLPILICNSIREKYEENFEFIFCNIDAFIAALTGFVSIWSLTALAYDRCIVICRRLPMRKAVDKTVAYITVIGIWIFCCVGSSLPFSGFGRYVLDGSNFSCTFDFFTKSRLNILYNVIIHIFFFGIPVICITACYSIICVTVWNHERKYFRASKYGERQHALRRMNKNRKHERNELKTAKAGLIIITVFCVSWLPYSVISLVALFGDSDGITRVVVSIPVIFAKISTIMNPLLYALLHKSFQSKLFLFFRQNLCSTSPYLTNSHLEQHHMEVMNEELHNRRKYSSRSRTIRVTVS